jgi:putative nucleotide binding protein
MKQEGPSGKKKENYAYVLDVYEADTSFTHKRLRGTIAQLLGEEHFILLESIVKPEAVVKTLDRVYIGPGPRNVISAILRKIEMEDLTPIAKAELERALEKNMLLNEERWVAYINRMGPLTKKLHSLELLPGVGKKTMWDIIGEREKRPFQGFRDIYQRVGLDIVKLMAKRVVEEMEGGQKYYIFIKPPEEEAPEEYRPPYWRETPSQRRSF